MSAVTIKTKMFDRECPQCGRKFKTPYENDIFCRLDCIERYWQKADAWKQLNDIANQYGLDYIPLP